MKLEQLGEQRAESVAQWMSSSDRLDEERIVIKPWEKQKGEGLSVLLEIDVSK